MKILQLTTGIVLSFLLTSPVFAFESYYTHWWTPYPPSCVFTLTLPRGVDTQGDAQNLVSESINFSSDDATLPPVEVEIEVIRRACMEDNRSALFMTFRNPTGHSRHQNFLRALRINFTLCDFQGNPTRGLKTIQPRHSKRT
jgi:hypothetical protein